MHDIETAVGKRQRLGIGFLEFDGQPFSGGALPGAIEQRADVVGRGDIGPVPGRRQRSVAIARGDIEHALAGPHVDGFAQALADELQRGADDAVVAGGPGGLLALLDGGKVGMRDCGAHDLEPFVH